MTKKELIANAAQNANVTRKVADAVIEDFLATVTKELSEGNDVVLTGFGTFKVKTRAARMGRNLKTQEPVEIPETKVITFKPSSAVKNAVND